MRQPHKTSTGQDPNFDWRGNEVGRIENLSDIVFALSLSLLAVASTPPATFTELMTIFKSAFAFAFAFAILLLIWNYHYLFFRRYGLTDSMTVFLNAVLLFVVLLFVYPLRFLADFLFTLIPAFFNGFEEVETMISGVDQGADLLIIYCIGYAAVFLIIAALYSHAAARRSALDLSETELTLTRRSRASALAQAGVALFVAGLAALTPLGPWAGMCFFLAGPADAAAQMRYRVKSKTAAG